jgi:hypothetical protein
MRVKNLDMYSRGKDDIGWVANQARSNPFLCGFILLFGLLLAPARFFLVLILKADKTTRQQTEETQY